MDIIIQNLHLSLNGDQVVKSGYAPYTKENCPDGVYIKDESGKLWLPQFWGLSDKKADSVAFLKGKTRILVALKGSDNDLELLPSGKKTNIAKRGDIDEALKDVSGMDNMDELCRNESKAAKFCRDKSFEWRLPTLPEINELFSEKKIIDAAITIAGGEPLYSVWYWTSTKYSEFSYWIFDWSNGDRDSNNQNNDYRVRPVSAFL